MAGAPSHTRFADGKDAGALRTIGEVATALGIRQHVLRYWEQQFPMLRPMTRSGGRRYYRPADVALVERIDRLVNHEGYTLKGAARALRDGSTDSPAGAEPAAAERMEVVRPDRAQAELLAQLKSIRARLAAALDA